MGLDRWVVVVMSRLVSVVVAPTTEVVIVVVAPLDTTTTQLVNVRCISSVMCIYLHTYEHK